jgi:hypothetical protein
MEGLELNRIFRERKSWSQGAEARNCRGTPVHFDHPSATAYSLDGALFKVLGETRAMVVMPRFTGHMVGDPPGVYWAGDDPPGDALRALKDFNDAETTKYGNWRKRLLTLPIWS